MKERLTTKTEWPFIHGYVVRFEDVNDIFDNAVSSCLIKVLVVRAHAVYVIHDHTALAGERKENICIVSYGDLFLPI